MTFDIGLWAAVGFILAAYAVVANDALQTLGTFINSNRNRHWTVLFGFAGVVLVATFAYGWFVNGGDPSYGRLANESKYPVIDIEWYHILPPAVLLLITRLGIPVSTSFMVLTIFASIGGLGSMLEKSLIGYGVAFGVGFGLFMLLSPTLEKWFEKSDLSSFVPFGLIAIVGTAFFASQYYVFGTIERAEAFYVGVGCVLLLEAVGLALAFTNNRSLYWVTAQWATTAYLWSIWLIQDFANIFVFLPRELTATEGFGAMGVILVLLAITFANNGGPVQRILRTKSNVIDIRSATIIDFCYASLLFFFKELSDIPMSTTWVFLGLIAGRQYAFALTRKAISVAYSVIDTAEDVAKAFIGIVLSIDLAVGLPTIAQLVAGEAVTFADVFPNQVFGVTVAVANAALLPIIYFAFSKPEEHVDRNRLVWAIGTVVMLLFMVGLTFRFPLVS